MSWFAQKLRRSEDTGETATVTATPPVASGPGYYRKSRLVEKRDALVPEEHVERGAPELDQRLAASSLRARSSLLRMVVWVFAGVLALQGAEGTLGLMFAKGRFAARAYAQEDASLWNEREGFRFTNRKAMAVGDLITVVVVESSSGRNRASLSTSKEHKVEMEGGPGAGPLDFIPFFQLDSNTKNELSGDGQVSLSGELRTTITVQVIDMRPNGQLVVEGSRTITLNKEEDRITLRGVARPEDITSDNTILSTKLAEVRISYDGKGATKRASRPGIIQRIFGWIF